MNNCGVLFIATGEKYVKAAIRAALTVCKYNPNLPLHLFTEVDSFNNFFNKSTKPFTSIGIIDNPHQRSKVDYMSLTPFTRTLYLDTDIAVRANICSLFDVLDRFDIAMAHAQHRAERNLKPWRITLPDAFPEFNSGVVLYRSTKLVIEFLEDWGKHFLTDWVEVGKRNKQVNHDQTPLRELLWLSDLRIATLPPEYNVRYLKYHYLWSKSEAESKIFHLKQFHHGWLPWFFKQSRLKKNLRRLKPIRKNKVLKRL